MTDYSIYNQLDVTEPHFRLVSIHPASEEEEPIRCSLTTTRMEDAPEYEALSYTWGDPADPEPITVNNRPFFATKNLAQALRGLRHQDRDRVMWIDAVAICQTDKVEKNNQIPLMTRIYGDAARVIVWLGEGGEAAELIRSARKDKLHWDSRNQPSLKYDMLHATLKLRDLFASPWWERVWTIQEMLLARELEFHCGHGVILTEEEVFGMPMEYTAHASNCCRDLDDPESTGYPYMTFKPTIERLMQPIRTMHNFRQRIREYNNKLPIEPLAIQFRYRKATDPRDKLYGLLGISEYPACPPPIDYRRPIADCYKAMACWMIHTSRSLAVLNMVVTHPSREEQEPITEEMPSWCPNWDALPDSRTFVATEARIFDFALYNASREGFDTDLFFPIPEHPTSSAIQLVVPSETDHFWMPINEIALLGLPFDTVKAVDPVKDVDSTEMIAFNLALPRWKALAKSTMTRSTLKDSIYPSGNGDAEEALNRTLCADIMGRKSHDGETLMPAIPEFYSEVENAADDFARFWATVEAMPPDHLDNSFISRQHPRVSSAVTVATKNRRFFVTEKGYFGLGSPTTQEGDEVWILSGGNTPYILRQTDGPSSRNRIFVGEAYVHGIMQGEALNEHILDNGNVKFQVVVLK